MSKYKYENILTREFFEIEYFKKDRTIKEISSELGINDTIIYDYLYYRGLKCKQSYKIKEGDTYNGLTLIKDVGTSKSGRLWLIKCKCGKEFIKPGNLVKRGRVTNCGHTKHAKGDNNKLWKGCGDITGQYFSHIRERANRFRKEFDITVEYLWELFLKQDRKCAITKIPIGFSKIKGKINNTASLDRIDNSKGYVKGNVWWVHKRVNVMKLDDSLEEFLHWCKLIVENS